MQFPKLTPLQSRLAASLIASAILVLVYLFLTPNHFAYAAELDSILQEDHNHHRLHARVPTDLLDDLDDYDDAEGYEAEFMGVSRSIIGRVAAFSDALTNNVVNRMDIDPGLTHNYVFAKAQIMGNHTDKGVGFPSALQLQRRSVKQDESEALILNQEELGEGELMDEEETEDILKRQNEGPAVYISVNACRQPSPNGTVSGSPPHLTMYISKTNTAPGRDSQKDLVTPPIPFQGGFANYTLNSTGDVYIGVSAPDLPKNYAGNWHFEIAASIDGPYQQYHDSEFLYPVDADSGSALFITHGLTPNDTMHNVDEEWVKFGPLFTMYAFPQDYQPIKGLEQSFCAIRESFDAASLPVSTGMTRRMTPDLNQTMTSQTKQQFHIEGLNASSTYTAYLAMVGNGTTEGPDVPDGAVVGGGGQVWKAVNFSTKADGNCQVIYNLTFCSDVAYAVPANPSKFNATGLASLYDTQAQSYYDNFTKSIAQVACDTTDTARYSLAKTCDDCRQDYKNWLCAVQIPRCEDFSASPDLAYLQPRNIGQDFINGTKPAANATAEKRLSFKQSRNPLIDSVIQPGPYKELLPCEDLCYSIVQSCPANLGFSCPSGGNMAAGYGKRDPTKNNMTCSYLGAVLQKPNGGGRQSVSAGTLVGVAVLAVMIMG
ncbi:uncharacterized protein BDZ99DRAFT_461843 [Mytilinidion resinicola]|uniref:FZ domain-containing protein n=1 Tax=Mytilinidion resinicola TaxID=574789 RepID=A0A6A6YSF9_9PEZI|nr:uncharacterized protein BDZ99DRAFT_461843 [Mytilinidion resinicola]KAF2811886.1 hypothetical protein BDZ99DRAFT_461843 [Mytilinidion resinicola]